MGSHDNTNSPKLNASSGGQHQSIQSKRVFIDNTTDSILNKNQSEKIAQFAQQDAQKQMKQNSSFIGKPVGIMSGTGTTEHPKGKSTSPRGTLGSSVVGLPNLKVGIPTASNLTKVNTKNPNEQSPKGKENENNQDQRLAAADKEMDDFLADNL